MIISIISEMDTRTVIYALMQTLHRYGRVCVISSNKYLSRLIDGTFEDDFCGIHVVVVNSDEDISSFDFDTYDYTIVDGVVVQGADRIIAVVGHKVSLTFGYELEAVVGNDNFHLIKCGMKPKTAPVKKSKDKTTEAEVDDHENDWAKDISTQQKLSDLFMSKKSEWIPFMSLTEMENLEGEHKWSLINKVAYKRFYEIIGASLGIDEYTYLKGGGMKDEDGDSVDSISVW